MLQYLSIGSSLSTSWEEFSDTKTFPSLLHDEEKKRGRKRYREMSEGEKSCRELPLKSRKMMMIHSVLEMMMQVVDSFSHSLFFPLLVNGRRKRSVSIPLRKRKKKKDEEEKRVAITKWNGPFWMNEMSRGQRWDTRVRNTGIRNTLTVRGEGRELVKNVLSRMDQSKRIRHLKFVTLAEKKHSRKRKKNSYVRESCIHVFFPSENFLCSFLRFPLLVIRKKDWKKEAW